MIKRELRGAIILCGGQSSRMGLPKATLPFGPECMLERVIRLLAQVVETMVVVAAPGQEVPQLADGIRVVTDRREGRGPLEGLAVGLGALQGKADAVYATSCDVPLLVPAFVERLFGLVGSNDVVVPKEGKFHHPLASVYRTHVVDEVETLLQDDRLRPFYLFEKVPTLEVPIDDLREYDPDLLTLRNANRPQDYFDALAIAGFELAPEVASKLECSPS